jgi:hypothetical protein
MVRAPASRMMAEGFFSSVMPMDVWPVRRPCACSRGYGAV